MDSPPNSMLVQFDLHGVRCTVRPQRARPMWVQMLYAALTFIAMMLGLGVAATVSLAAHATDDLSFLLGLFPVFGWWGGVLWLAVVDRTQQLERLDVRVGEGWLVVRHHVANLMQEDAGRIMDEEAAFLMESERVDLRTCIDCRVTSGPILRVQRVEGESVAIPMRGHDLDEIGWLAGAINRGIRDARREDVPIPSALAAMMDPERTGPPARS